MSEFYHVTKTPITEDTFERQGWTKIEDNDGEEDFTYYMLPIPKDNPDPAALCLITSADDEHELFELNDGEFVVELDIFPGLGHCETEEELELLYRVLTKRHIDK